MSYGLNMERMNNAVDTYLSHIQIHNKKFSDDFNLRHTISNLSEIEEKINNDESYEEIDTRLASGWYVASVDNSKKKKYRTKEVSYKISKKT